MVDIQNAIQEIKEIENRLEQLKARKLELIHELMDDA